MLNPKDRHTLLRLLALLTDSYNSTDDEIFDRFEKSFDVLWESDEPSIQKFHREAFPDGKPSPDTYLDMVASVVLPKDTPPS